MQDEWVTVQDIAERLKVDEQTVRRWLRAGDLAGHNFSGRTGWRIRAQDVNAFVEGKRNGNDGRVRDPKHGN